MEPITRERWRDLVNEKRRKQKEDFWKTTIDRALEMRVNFPQFEFHAPFYYPTKPEQAFAWAKEMFPDFEVTLTIRDDENYAHFADSFRYRIEVKFDGDGIEFFDP